MRIVLATGLFAIGVELPKAYVAEHARSLLIMVVPTMAFGWLISAGKQLFGDIGAVLHSLHSHHSCSIPSSIFRIIARDLCLFNSDGSRVGIRHNRR